MSTVIVTPPPVPPPADPDSLAPPTLTVTFYQQLAEHLSTALDEIAAALPNLDPAQQISGPTFIRARLNIPLVFLGTAIASVHQVPELQALDKFDAFEAQDTLQLIEAFRPLRDKIRAFEKDLATVLNARQSALALAALDTYDVVKSLTRDPNNAPVAMAYAALKRDLGRSGPRKKKTDSEPPPAPVPATSLTASYTAKGGKG